MPIRVSMASFVRQDSADQEPQVERADRCSMDSTIAWAPRYLKIQEANIKRSQERNPVLPV